MTYLGAPHCELFNDVEDVTVPREELDRLLEEVGHPCLISRLSITCGNCSMNRVDH
jgi:hypothetical protein